jgi:hypothetical protein
MSRLIGWSFLWFAAFRLLAEADVLIVADEIPAMEAFAQHLQQDARLTSQIVTQTNLPANLKAFSTVTVYIHRALLEPTEINLIQYTTNGGKLLVLHHSISSGKRQNKYWFGFLGLQLPQGKLAEGGYTWIEPASWEVVNINPSHYVTTQRCNYDRAIEFGATDKEPDGHRLNAFHLDESEVYLNHEFVGSRTLLLGLKYTDPSSGKTYFQERAGWHMKSGQGHIFYFMPGHSAREFNHPVYRQLLLNAIRYRPDRQADP